MFSAEALLSREGAIFSALVASCAFKHLWLARVSKARDQRFTLVGHVSELVVYPIKSCGGVELQSALATDVGLATEAYYDRRWMIQVKDTGDYLTMKEEPRLTLVTCAADGDWLVISAPDMTPLRLPKYPNPNKCQRVTAQFHEATIPALDVSREANDWMTKFLGRPVRLLHSGPGIGTLDAYDRGFSWETEARLGDKAVFAYLTAYLLCSTASLDELNHRLSASVSVRNFRPNIVVENSVPFDEDTWEEVRIGSTATFHYVQPCRRCTITTINPQTAEHGAGNQPLAMLRKYRQRAPYGHSPLFGAYIATDCEGLVKVGDPVHAIRRQSAPS